MNHDEIERIEALSMQSVPFPEIVPQLVAAGVESYYTDLVRLEKVLYGIDGGAYTHTLRLSDAPAIAPQFSEAGVRAALAAIQQRQIGYPEFLRQVMRAGTISYLAYLRGRRVLYLGRDGQFHVELFPSPK